MERKANLTEGPVGRRLVYLTGPMIMGIFAMVVFNLADTYFVAQLGTIPLAAMSFTFPVVMVIHSVALGLGIGTSSVVARAIGEGDSRKVRRLATHSLLLAIMIVLLLVIAGLLTIEPVFTMLGATPETLPLVRQYMTVWYMGIVFVTVPMVGNNVIRATGDTKFPAMIMMFAAALNFVLDPLLIFGLAGFPRLELVGAALATVIGRAVTLVLSLSILHFREKLLDFSLPPLRAVWDSWKKILYIGIPSATTNLMVPLSSAVIIRIVSRFGTTSVAAVGAGTRVQAFAMIVVIALGTSLVPFIGQNWGAGKFDRVHRAHHLSARFSFFWGLLCVAAFFFTAEPIARLFSRDPAVIDGIVGYLWIMPIGYGMLGITNLTSASFNAINKPLVAASITLIHMFVLYVPLAYMGAVLIGFRGVFGGMSLANIVAGVMSLLIVSYARKRLEPVPVSAIDPASRT